MIPFRADELFAMFLLDPVSASYPQIKPENGYETWPVQKKNEEMIRKILQKEKTVHTSVALLYQFYRQKLPEEGTVTVVVDSDRNAVCLLLTTEVKVLPFREITEEIAFAECEGDRTLLSWKKYHKSQLRRSLKSGFVIEDLKIVVERFKVIYPVL